MPISAYIAMMVSPEAADLVRGNPAIDEVIVLDKDAEHRGIKGSLGMARFLRQKKFDLALVLHPTNRVHLLMFLAGIPRRVGYYRKLGFLLTDKIAHKKQLGEKHEREYTLDVVRYLGIIPRETALYIPISPESAAWVKGFFEQEKINPQDRLLAVHPGASCPSKIWPVERYSEVADCLHERYGLRVVVVGGRQQAYLAQRVVEGMKHPAINIAGKTSVGQLAALLKECDLFLSNDSGPVHIASAVGTPVVSIFGRAQKGLSPLRWGPTGSRDRALHQDVGCIQCLAHNCRKEFLCLRSITADAVISAAASILGDTCKEAKR